jgi:hypothetical protein
MAKNSPFRMFVQSEQLHLVVMKPSTFTQWRLLAEHLIRLDMNLDMKTKEAAGSVPKTTTCMVSYSGYENVCEGKQHVWCPTVAMRMCAKVSSMCGVLQWL